MSEPVVTLENLRRVLAEADAALEREREAIARDSFRFTHEPTLPQVRGRLWPAGRGEDDDD
jgi:hypothetical protein